MEKSKTVEAYLEKQSHWKEELLLLRKLLLQTGMEETIKWGAPVYVAHSKNIVGLAGFKNHFCFWFFQGALLKDTHKKLLNAQEGKTQAMRQWRFENIEEIEPDLVLAYVNEAIAHAKAGKEIKPQKKKEVAMSVELEQAVKQDSHLLDCFKALTPYKQKEYKEHIGSAKQEKTRIARLEKCLPMIKDGKGLNDKYKNC